MVIYVAAAKGHWRWGSGTGSGQPGGAEDEGGGLPRDPGGWGARRRGQQPRLDLPRGRGGLDSCHLASPGLEGWGCPPLAVMAEPGRRGRDRWWWA